MPHNSFLNLSDILFRLKRALSPLYTVLVVKGLTCKSQLQDKGEWSSLVKYLSIIYQGKLSS